MSNTELANITPLILTVRGRRVILDADLAALYQVPTKRLNEQVKRNIERFPEEFSFQLTREEAESLRSQNATLQQLSHFRYLPRVFSEHGALMAANVLNSPRAVSMSVSGSAPVVLNRGPVASRATTSYTPDDSSLIEISIFLRNSCASCRPAALGRD